MHHRLVNRHTQLGQIDGLLYIVDMQATLYVLRDYIRSWYAVAFHKVYFTAVVCMLAVIIFCNYNGYFRQNNNAWLDYFFNYLLYLLPFAFAYLLQWFCFKNDRAFFSRPWFWILVLLAPAVFALRMNFNNFFSLSFIHRQSPFAISCVNYISRILIITVPVTLLWYFKDRKKYPLYGFTRCNNYRLYFLLLAFMVPFISLAASRPDFLSVYPKAITSAGLKHADDMGRLVLFEFIYGLDFFSIEFFFRGFLVIAFTRYCGMKAILPAACFYCCIHLGKPMGEAISSFFGGMLLGIISYHTSGIWGGLIIHVGIAWLMELAAYISRSI